METISNLFLGAIKALTVLLYIVVFSAIQTVSRDEKNKRNSVAEVLLSGLFISALVAFFLSTLSSCIVADDYVFGGCEAYSDEDKILTRSEQAKKFGLFFTLLFTPVIAGVASKKKYEA